MKGDLSENRRRVAVMALVVIGILALVGWGLFSLLGGHGTVSKKPPKISLLPPTPPPPPPPPKEEKKPEPKEEKEMKVEQAEKKEQAPDPSLKMEGAAGDGPSPFAAGKVTSEDLSKLGTGNGGLTDPFNVYANSIKGQLQRYLARRSELKRRQYRVDLRVWVGEDGHLRNFELLGTTNDVDTDEAIRSALTTLSSFSEPPPANMPQPIKLRIVASGRM